MQRSEVVPPPSANVKASVTALSVAMAFTRALAMGHAYLFNQARLDLATHLWQTGRQSLDGFNWAFASVVSQAPFSVQRSIFNRIVAPGYDQTIMVRKYMIAEKMREAISQGATQVVVLGGGYDVGSFFTAIENPEVTVFELDRGPTRESKINGLMSIPKGIGFDHVQPRKDNGTLFVGRNLCYAECDLATDDLFKRLTSLGFVAGEKTVFVGEGLSMYLSREQNERLLDTIYSLLTDQGELLLSYMSPRVDISAIERNALESSKETYQCSLQPNEVISFTAPHGFEVCQKFNAAHRLREVGVSEQGLHHEWYYSLRKSDRGAEKRIEEVPTMNFVIPANTTAPSASSMCTLI